MLQTGANVEFCRDGADDLHIVFEQSARIDQHIRASLQFAVVLWPHMLPCPEGVSSYSWGRIGRIIAVAIRLRCGRRRGSQRAARLQVPALTLYRRRPVGKV